MKVELELDGSGLLRVDHFLDKTYEMDIIPRTGDEIIAEELYAIASFLDFPDDDEPWLVESVRWFLPDTNEYYDVGIKVTNKHFNAMFDLAFEKLRGITPQEPSE